MRRRGLATIDPTLIAPGVYSVQPRNRRSRLVRAALAVVLALALIVAVFAGIVVFVLAPHFKGPVDTIPSRVHAMLRRRADPYTPFHDIAPVMLHAVVAIEDRRFYKHHGVDLEGLFRAVAVDLRERQPVQGGSTITEQLDERTLFQGHTTAIRELELLPLAWETENRFTKTQILELYLNDAYFGRAAYGIAAASEAYFRRRPDQLDVAQAAFLAGLVQAPSIYGDHPHSEAMQARWQSVVRDLFAQGYISHSQEFRVFRSGVHVMP